MKGKMPFMGKDAKEMKTGKKKKYASGGSVGGFRSSADGIVSKGKTKVSYPKMSGCK